jgi:hypothetical protein
MNRHIDLRPLCAALALGALLAACGRAPEPAEPSPPATAEASAECVRTPPAEPMVCTMDWRPVCGCDGITYPNACSARAAGVTDFSAGECAVDAAARRD